MKSKERRLAGSLFALHSVAAIGFGLCMTGFYAHADASKSNGAFFDQDLASTCGAPPPGDHTKGKRDYRARFSSEEWKNDFRDFETYHMSRAERNMAPGGRAVDVMENFHFVLRRSPNHQRAMELMIKWSSAGGHDERFAKPSCFFVWGTEFVPDDPVVWRLGGLYFWKTGDVRRAQHWWEEAVRIDPESADAHYSLGLLYFDAGNFESSRKHARAAYEAGYPLPGLRNKLEAVGQWQSTTAN